MGWQSDLFTNITFYKETYNTKYEVESKIEEINACIKTAEKELRDLAVMTEPDKMLKAQNSDPDETPYWRVTRAVEDNLELLNEYYIERYKLNMLLENWDKCHNEKGLAIPPPNNVGWDAAYFDGDFVETVENPDANSASSLLNSSKSEETQES